MKQTYFTILISIFITLPAMGQVHFNRIHTDTIQVYPDRAFVDYRAYSNSFLTEQGQAFIYPDTIFIRKSRWLPRFIKTSIPADSVVLHGTVTSHRPDGKFRIGKYDNGQKIEMLYFDAEGNEINQKDFYGELRSPWDPEQGTSKYFIHGTRKKK